MRWIIILTFSTSLGFFGCSTNSTESSSSDFITLNISDAVDLPVKSLKILDLIPLETNAQNLMGNELRVRFTNQRIYVMDMGQRDGIHIFTSHGKFLKTVAIKGDGPNELKGLQDFQVNADDQIYVLGTVGDLTTIYQIIEQDKIQKITAVSYLASAFTLASNNEFYLYGSYNKPFVTHRLVRVNSSGQVLESYLPNSYTNEMIPMTERNFFEYGDNNFLLSEVFNDTLYTLQNERFEPFLKFDFNRYQIPREFWEKDLMQGYQLIQENGFAVFKATFENSVRIIANVHFQGQDIGTQKRIYLYEKLSGDFHQLDYPENEAEIWSDPVGFDKDQLLFLTYHSFLRGNQRLDTEEIQLKIPEQEFDYPILIKTTIK
jgi:uncharacterized protein YwgA